MHGKLLIFFVFSIDSAFLSAGNFIAQLNELFV